MAYCQECGGEVAADDWFCQHCGAELDYLTADEQGQTGSTETAHDDWVEGQPVDGDTGWTADDPSTGGTVGGSDDGQRSSIDGGQGNWRDQSGAEPAGQESAGADEAALHETDPFTFTFKYPISSGWRPLVVSALLFLGSLFVLPVLVLTGYAYRVARAAALGEPTAPVYEDWGGLLVDGIRYLVLSAVVAVGFYAAVGGIVLLGSEATLALFLLVPVYVGFGYAMPALLVTFVATDSVTAPFTTRRAVDFLLTVEYLKAFLIGLGVAFALEFLLVFSFVTIVGWIVAIPYFWLAYAAYWGYAYRDAAENGAVPPASGTVGDTGDEGAVGGPAGASGD